MLIRLERLGWLASRWEENEENGPRRRLYRLTAEGEPAARSLLVEAGARGGRDARTFNPIPAGGPAA
jgi:DNA-binding PadR family transcriptional regulator